MSGTAGTPPAPSLGGRRRWMWILFGILLPVVAFWIDSGMRIDPVLWSSGGFGDWGNGFGRSGAPVLGLRQLLVYGFIALSFAGLVLTLTSRGSRVRIALALPLLVSGVLVSGLHSLAFLPLIPISFTAILFMGIGLLGFSPFLALGVYVDALRWAVLEQARITGGRPAWVLGPLAAGLILSAAAAVPHQMQRRALDVLREGTPASVSRGFGRLGVMAELSRPEILRIYPDLPAEAQIRLRNLYLERFGRDLHEEINLDGFR